jgi:redox-sensitive bicupin YhaK (pirin superfamily)
MLCCYINGENSYSCEQGPFHTVQPVQMIDYELSAGSSLSHALPVDLDNCIVFVYRGGGEIGSETVEQYQSVRFDGTNADARLFTATAGIH